MNNNRTKQDFINNSHPQIKEVAVFKTWHKNENDTNRSFSFLTQHIKLPSEFVNDLLKNGIIAETPYKESNNLVACGYEEEGGKKDYQEMFGTYTTGSYYYFRAEYKNEDSWFAYNPNPEQQIHNIYLCQSVLDALCLYQYQITTEENYQNSLYISTGGRMNEAMYDRAMVWYGLEPIVAMCTRQAKEYLEQNPKTETCLPTEKYWVMDWLATQSEWGPVEELPF